MRSQKNDSTPRPNLLLTTPTIRTFYRYYLSAILKDYDVKGVSNIGESDSLQVTPCYTFFKFKSIHTFKGQTNQNDVTLWNQPYLNENVDSVDESSAILWLKHPSKGFVKSKTQNIELKTFYLDFCPFSSM